MKVNKKITCMIAALFTVLAFATANQPIANEAALEVLNTDSSFTICIIKFGLNYEKAYGVNSSIIFFLLTYFYYQVNKNRDDHDKKLNRVTLCRRGDFCYFYGIGK